MSSCNLFYAFSVLFLIWKSVPVEQLELITRRNHQSSFDQILHNLLNSNKNACQRCHVIKPPNCSVFPGRQCSEPTIIYNDRGKCQKAKVWCEDGYLAILGTVHGGYDLYFLEKSRQNWWSSVRGGQLIASIRMITYVHCTDYENWLAVADLHGYGYQNVTIDKVLCFQQILQ